MWQTSSPLLIVQESPDSTQPSTKIEVHTLRKYLQVLSVIHELAFIRAMQFSRPREKNKWSSYIQPWRQEFYYTHEFVPYFPQSAEGVFSFLYSYYSENFSSYYHLWILLLLGLQMKHRWSRLRNVSHEYTCLDTSTYLVLRSWLLGTFFVVH
jgi:hypothetical protein